MRSVRTSLPTDLYSVFDLEVGRQGVSTAEALRQAVTLWLCLSARQRAQAALRGEHPFRLNTGEKAPDDTGAW
jgi:hypothetical protein